MSETGKILLVLVCLTGYAFFAGMETGIVAMRRLRLWHLVREKARGARHVLSMVEHPDRFLGTTLVGTNLCSVVASVTAANLASQWAGNWGRLAAGAVMAVAVLVFCEYLPKNWFRNRPVRTLPWAPLLRASGFVFAPVGALAAAVARALTPGKARTGDRSQPLLTRQDLIYLTHESQRDGALSTDERNMIQGVFMLNLKTAADLMTPRPKMHVVGPDMPVTKLLQLARRMEMSRLPVIDPQSNRFIGVVFVPDAAAAVESGSVAGDFMRPPQFVPANLPADALLPRMRLTRQPLALVVDNASQVIGLVTTEDVLQVIVGNQISAISLH